MCSIVNNLKSVLISNLLNAFGVARFTITMNRHNCRCSRCDGCFNLIRINVASSRININEYRFTVIPPNRVSSCNKTIRGSNDFTCNAKCLKSSHQGKRTICKEANIRYMEIFGQSIFELLVILSHVSNPLTVPNLLKLSSKMLKIRK